MGLKENNVERAFQFSDSLTEKSSGLIVSVGLTEAGMIYLAHDKTMPVEVLIQLLEGTVVTLKAGKPKASVIITEH
jgi:hypothetical protein